MQGSKSHGIGYLVNNARANHFVFDEFVTQADAYFHYSNYILLEMSGSSAVLYLLFLLVDSSGSVISYLLIIFFGHVYLIYPGFKDNAKIFEGVLERYCGVPP